MRNHSSDIPSHECTFFQKYKLNNHEQQLGFKLNNAVGIGNKILLQNICNKILLQNVCNKILQRTFATDFVQQTFAAEFCKNNISTNLYNKFLQKPLATKVY